MTAIPLSKFKIAFDKFVEVYGENYPELSDLKLHYDPLGDEVCIRYDVELQHDKGYAYEWYGFFTFKEDNKND